MGWDELGIVDPELQWDGPLINWQANFLGELYDKTMQDIEFYQEDIDDLKRSEAWNDKLEEYCDWLDYIETIADESVTDCDFKIKLIKARIELKKFVDSFDGYMVSINWYEEH